MATESGHTPSPDQRLGPILAHMRRTRKLSGAQLGRLVGMSQPKISRLETGIGAPDPHDVGRIARALGADEAEVSRLVGLAERSHHRISDWRPHPSALVSRQRTLGGWESQAQVMRAFQPALIFDLLQTGEYARTVLTALQELIVSDPDTPPDVAVAQAVSARVRRQEILADHSRTFRLLTSEAALSNRICPPAQMLAQLLRLRQINGQPNVTMSIIPADASWRIPPIHGFVVLDDAMVTIDLLTTGITSHGPTDIRTYRRLFDALEEQSIDDIDPLLDRYIDIQLGLAEPRSRRPRPH